MKAILYKEYGGPEVLHVAEIETPAPKDNEVFIRVHATTVTAGDARVRRADPFLVRLFFGLRRPKMQILGGELAGQVEAVGKDVTQFKPGDRVVVQRGSALGGYVEYICIAEDGRIAHIPENVTYEEAAGMPFGASSSLFFLKEQGQIQPGQKVLIVGASGALGTSGVQLAKHFGAEVTGVCSTRNVDLVKSLGADHVIDYTKEDYTKNGQQYDIIYDTVGKSPFSASVRSLKKEGRFVRAVHMKPSVMLKGLWTNLTSKKNVLAGVAPDRREDLLFLRDLMAQGVLKTVIDSRYPVASIADAHRLVDSGRKRGSVIVSWVEEDGQGVHTTDQMHTRA